MWVLTLMVCVSLQCGEPEVLGEFETKKACIAAMDEEYKEMKPGSMVRCMKRTQWLPEIKT